MGRPVSPPGLLTGRTWPPTSTLECTLTPTSLRARRLGVDTRRAPILYLRADASVCRSEGFEAVGRVQVEAGGRSLLTVLHVVTSDLLLPGEAGLSEAAWDALDIEEGAELHLSHAPVLESFRHVRGKMHGVPFDRAAFDEVVRDLAAGRYPDLHIASFLTTCAGRSLDLAEITALTRAMIAVGERLTWDVVPVVDKHCIGGLPGNRTTPIVVAITAAAGLTIPKTSSRAITSPAGTADVMETMTRVDLDVHALRRVVNEHGGCLAWGGSMRLSPVDDLLIRVEKALDIDGHGQLVASVLSKKAAAGSTHTLIDIPWGPTAKVHTEAEGEALGRDLVTVGASVGVQVRYLLTDGRQPVGRGLGPALEARDVLAVLRNAPDAPPDLRARALTLAGHVLALDGGMPLPLAMSRAAALLHGGQAWERFLAICVAQGGFREPGVAKHTQAFVAAHAGRVAAFDNRQLARVAKLAGAPADPLAGLVLHVHLGDEVVAGQPLYTLHSDSRGGLEYAWDHHERHPEIVVLSPEPA